MKRIVSRAVWPLATALAFGLFCAGCGGGTPMQKAKGQVLVDGKNYQVGAREQLLVIFYPDVEQPPTTYPAEVKPDGSYETVGLEGRGIPPGKYRVGLSSPYGGGSVTIPKELGLSSSPIVREVVQGKDTIEPIDIMKPAG
ncbi:MAG: hypothetical protein ACR2FY_03490 [Pirellulaceae bacterium]